MSLRAWSASAAWTCRAMALQCTARAFWIASCATVPALAPCWPAAAAEPLATGDAPWLVTLGGYTLIAPRFEGAARYAPDWRPIFSFRRADGKDWLDLPYDGVGFELYETETFRFGPVVDWRLQRHVSNDICPGCRAFGSADVSLEGGVFAEYWPIDWLRTRLEVRHALVGGAGFVADLSSDAVWRATPTLLFAAGPRISVADRSFMRVYYDLDPAVAAAANAEETNTGAGLRAAGLNGFARWTISPQWAASAYTEFEHLIHAPISRPHIGSGGTSQESVTVGVGLSYTFAFRR